MKGLEFNYVDIHCHIMFGVDDGPDEIQTSREMLVTAHSEGIRKIVATPHYHPGKCTMQYEELSKKFEDFKNMAKGICPDLKLYLGREVYYTSDILQELEEDSNISMNNTKYVLLEYQPSAEYSYLRTSINNVCQEGYIPIIAHVERYMCILKDWERIYELKNMGAAIQVNANSVIGEAGTTVKKVIKKLMKNGLVDLVATDAHSNGKRAPRMQECAKYICKKYGQEYAQAVLCDNAECILQGKYLED
jgi:protein-tyrosine phosphatase